ncbi:monovalent cation/H+ antiporter subunit A [Sulfuriflexus sp.]|uniref:monovalent cation/H+ antiporter subunit A n=1 Tax=Sulfuriflexus sp. TaxID=2015443 RepID=UPI0028CEAB4B|nr:monovalent cation/H+ antiporter subunit A [Sulfuriflexus sp.]MDT8405155.1 monovalent cation/H+ antiporter subunit A [Sulfuriflexus sp.]
MTLSLLLIVFAGSALTAWVSRLGRLYAAWAAGAVTLLALLLLSLQLPAVFAGETLIERWPWMSQAGMDLVFRLDGLGLLFALLILSIGLLVIFYARYYLSAQDSMGRFYSYLLLFMGAMLGIALSENIIQLLIFWELTSLSSFLLISYWQHRADARQGARMALAITGAGGLAMLGGFVLLGQIAGSYELSVILDSGDIIRAHPLYLPMLVLVLLGAFTKSAQFPFHFWLPNAMSAPTPVSAYLHSATMVKAGVFLLARLFPALSGTPEWSWLVGSVGLATFLVGAFYALFQHDLKGLLAYSTISHLGLITVLFGIGTPLAAVAGVFHMINHAIFKASLFMAAGIIDHESGSRDMRKLNGLWKYMPHTALLAMVAAASMAGVPLLNGFLSKEMFFAEAVSAGTYFQLGWMLPVLITLGGVFAVAYSFRFIHDVFFNGEPVDLPKTPHEPPRWMKIPVEVLVALCLLVGILPSLTVEPMLRVAAAGLLQTAPPAFDLAIWHGFSPALLMSIVALLGGGALYAMRTPLYALHEQYGNRLQGKTLFDALMTALFAGACAITRWLDTGSLQRLMLSFFIAVLVLGGAGYLGSGSPLSGARELLPLDGISLIAAGGLMLAAIATVVLHRQRFMALVLIGAVGLVVALIFVKFSAPDLALTQLSVEIVTIVLLLLALYFLPQQPGRESGHPRVVRDVLLAGLSGIGATLLAWSVLSRPYQSIAGYFIDNAKPGGGGYNVVNVILVDFRGYDTLGEIAVLALAALGIFAMLEHLQLSGPSTDGRRPWNWDMHPSVMASLTRLLLPLALLVSIFILLRGHNQPGGGFIAGLITAVALIMQYLANGVDWTQSRLPANMHPLIATGLLLATLTGLGSWLVGHAFLTSSFTYLDWPLLGKFEIASAMAFDVGVYLVVIGATLLILIHLGLMHSASHEPVDTKESY